MFCLCLRYDETSKIVKYMKQTKQCQNCKSEFIIDASDFLFYENKI